MTACAANVSYVQLEEVADHNGEAGDLAEWRATVTRDISNLRERIALLEDKKDSAQGSDANPKVGSVIDQTDSDSSIEVVKCCSTFRLLGVTRLTPLVALQIFWLVVCIAAFTSIGVIQFCKAHLNHNSEWKPEKKAYTIDYGEKNPTAQYDMPYVYVIFNFLNDDVDGWFVQWTEDMMDDIVSGLQELDDDLYTSFIVYDDDYNNWIGLDYEEFGVYSFGFEAPIFYAGLAFKFTDPDPALGDFRTALLLNLSTLYTLDHVDEVIGFHVSVGRNPFNLYDGTYASADVEYWSVFYVEYTETVVHKVDLSTSTSFTTNLDGEEVSEPGDWTPAGTAISMINGDMVVEHWQEYVDYDYIDWFMAMGGMFTVCVTAFVFVASLVPQVLHNDVSMGILPKFSRTYRNFRDIRQVCESVKALGTQNSL